MTYIMKDFEFAKAELENSLQELKTESKYVAAAFFGIPTTPQELESYSASNQKAASAAYCPQ